MSALPRNHSKRAVDVIQSHLVRRLRRLRSRSWAAKCLQASFLVVQQAARAGSGEVPAAPVVALEPPELFTESRRDAALHTSVQMGERFQQQRDGVGAERGGI